jgi:hypothetical protein
MAAAKRDKRRRDSYKVTSSNPPEDLYSGDMLG